MIAPVPTARILSKLPFCPFLDPLEHNMPILDIPTVSQPQHDAEPGKMPRLVVAIVRFHTLPCNIHHVPVVEARDGLEDPAAADAHAAGDPAHDVCPQGPGAGVPRLAGAGVDCRANGEAEGRRVPERGRVVVRVQKDVSDGEGELGLGRRSMVVVVVSGGVVVVFG